MCVHGFGNEKEVEETKKFKKVEKKLKERVQGQIGRTQKEYYLNEQMKAIQKELGDGEDGRGELEELEEALADTKMPKAAREKADAELRKLRNMGPMSAEATVVRNYLDWILAVPWQKSSRLKKDINKAREILDADHYGLEKVKDRIIEFLAVQQRTKSVKGPILCLVGPPGVGKISLGKSISRATGRKYVRMALGGVRDEAEIRGHRRTYIGSMPGKIVQSLKKAETNNPLFLLDEVDKLGADWRGDPSSALLEVLDPAQNSTFQDHYMELDLDLSNVLFITTANTLNMPQPLLDRMEIIRLSGYTEDEKLEIAKRHLMGRQIKDHGLKDGELTVTDDAIRGIIRNYTREAGVRSLERELAKIARKTRGFLAPEDNIRCIEAATSLPFDEGIKVEATLFMELMTGPQSAAQRYAFFAERQANKIPDIAKDTPTVDVQKAILSTSLAEWLARPASAQYVVNGDVIAFHLADITMKGA